MTGPRESADPHRLLMPPHPGEVYLSSALCSCGEWQFDADSPGALFNKYRAILREHTAHAAPPAVEPDLPSVEELAAARDSAYRERNAVVAALIRVGGYEAQVVMAPDTEGWWIVYAETPAGQVSWHISPDDMDLFSDWPVAFGTRPSPWDGHSTEEKYRRVAGLRATRLSGVQKP